MRRTPTGRRRATRYRALAAGLLLCAATAVGCAGPRFVAHASGLHAAVHETAVRQHLVRIDLELHNRSHDFRVIAPAGFVLDIIGPSSAAQTTDTNATANDSAGTGTGTGTGSRTAASPESPGAPRRAIIGSYVFEDRNADRVLVIRPAALELAPDDHVRMLLLFDLGSPPGPARLTLRIRGIHAGSTARASNPYPDFTLPLSPDTPPPPRR